MIKKCFSIIILIGFLFSCGIAPPKDMEETSFISFLDDNSNDIVNMMNDFSAFNLTGQSWMAESGILHIIKDLKIDFIQSEYPESDISTDSIIRSHNSGGVEFLRNIYVTIQKKDILAYSFDKKIWYSLDGDPKKYINFVPNINMNYERIDNQFIYNFSWQMREGSKPFLAKSKSFKPILEDKKVIILEPNLKMFDSKKIKTSLLKNNIVLIPKNSIALIDLNIKSNILDFSRTDKNSARIDFIRELFFYKSKTIFSLGFENRNYSDNFLSYSFSLKQEIYTNSEGIIILNNEGYIQNKRILKEETIK